MKTKQQKNSNKLSGYVILVSCAAALGGLLFGYDTAVISGAIGFLTIKFSLTSSMVGWVTSCILIGCAVGVAIAGTVSDKFGRKKALLSSAIIFAVSSLGAALATSVSILVFWRFLAGIGVGITSLLSPLYIAEIAPAHIRGRLVSLNQLAITIGIFVVYFVNAWIASTSTQTWNVNTGWRYMMGIGVLPSVLFLLFLIPAKESPRWLAGKGRSDEARNVLIKMDGSNQLVDNELAVIKASLQCETNKLSDLFKKRLRPALIIGVLLCIFQQFSGSNAIMYYAPEIFKNAGFGQSSAYIATVVIGATNMVLTIVSMGMVDRIGRKKLLGFGALSMSICLLLVSISFYAHFSGLVVFIFILLSIAAYAVSLAPVTWVVISEIFPTQLRGRAMSICTVLLWLSDFLLTETFPILTQGIGVATTFLLYTIITAIAAIFVWRVVPETKNKSLEEIESFWGKRLKKHEKNFSN
ncbi:sugar porter family MFS transporter [Clostridium psychrophilum]|uniref:sugar porter family MFS transporter n=1 Tax=Clostridium psychrophilum TaxID=132926 RepID=UPI001C0C40E5|nr:sugar porter family MFS transporter [Clostridium psychrophilum]MBU3182777.1 sugar porter family MFS transporter [Clostridium psychrophilum]